MRSKFSADDHGHYQFTPQNLTQWVLSLLRYDMAEGGDSSNSTPDGLLEIWAYEACRLFRDRLADEDACCRFDDILNNIVRGDWGLQALDKLEGIYYVTVGCSGFSSQQGPLPAFGKPLGKLNYSDWETSVEKAIRTFSHEVQDVNVVVFREVLDQIAKVDRVLTSPGGSLLLAGVSGVGRRLAASVVAHMHQATLFSPKISRNYGVKQFKNDLKSLFQVAGIDGHQVVMILEDHHLIDSQFLELVNSILAAGEIPGLYAPEEMEPLLGPLRDKSSQEGFRGSIYSYFAKRVQQNIHIVLVMNFSDPTFTVNCESNPSFYKCCSVQWWRGWSRDSMRQIPSMFLKKVVQDEGSSIGRNKSADQPIAGGDALLNGFLRIHENCKSNLSVPRRYVSFIHNYQAVYSRKKTGIEKRKHHLQAGVSKLNEAKALVDKLKSEAGEQSQLLAEKQAEADKALQQITTSMTNTTDQKTEMEGLKARMEEENKKIARRKIDIDKELEEIEPLIKEAKAAVGNIKAESLSEIRSLRAPPDVIRDILEGVLRLMGILDTSWVSMKSFLSKRGVKEDILAFDARRINPDMRDGVESLLKRNGESFDPKFDLSYLQLTTLIMDKLFQNLATAEHRITRLSTALVDVEQEVSHLRDRLNKFTKEAAEIEINLRKANETIEAAESLVQQLEGEYKRWTEQLGQIDQELEELPLRSLLAAAFITYLSEAPEDIRAATLSQWCEFLGLVNFDLCRFLSSEQEQLTWKSEGLPSDPLSIENAIIIMQTTLCPFLIDPSLRAVDWLKSHLKESQFEEVNQQDHNFVTSLELSVRFGKTLLVRDVDTLEPILFPVLRGDLTSQGPRYVIQIGEKLIDYNENFRLFLTTQNSLIELPPHASSILTTVNFTTTRAGLTGQLLAAVLQHEKPQLEERRSEVLKQEEEQKLQLTQLEESLLEQLASAQGNILENKELIASLNETKSSSSRITAALKESHQLQASLDEERKGYLPLAQFGSNLYFLILELTKLNTMYRFSLSSFLNLFNRALQTKAEWEAFVGMLVTDIKLEKSEMQAALPKWVPEERALAITLLKITFPHLVSALQLDDAAMWREFSASSQCEQDIPPTVVRQLSSFQQVLLIQALRPDRLQSALTLFGTRVLGLKELSPAAVNLRRIYENETQATEPILIIISPGADPSQELQEVSSQVVGAENYFQ
ncbi:cytoplasmic dynein 2 heavy chain 1-like, partial [Limulus polyphemus]|uniref:Cytoplasmic dynein 2 heavy chain 1-like n=1 Tax=Limulus polyphemus TaxID=6850 RepID=A0ABM1TPF0_LIMPO